MRNLFDFWKNNQFNVNIAWIIAGGYLIYLGGSTIYTTVQGKAELPFFLSMMIGLLFAGIGVFLLYREFKNTKKAAASKEDGDNNHE